MRCPFCDAEKESLKVIDSRTCEGGRAIRRRRQCLACNKRFTTYERIEENIRLVVIKKDGSRVPFDRSKILSGLERACYKRPVQEEDLHRIVDEVEEDVHKAYDKEVPSTVIGGMVTERLRRLDQVAYVRFASVYRQFKTLDELVQEAKAVIDAQRYEVPGQGRLFVEARNTAAAAAAGADAGTENGGHAAAAAAPEPPRPARPRRTAAREPVVQPE
jgi:transcriptional repressor NrdR